MENTPTVLELFFVLVVKMWSNVTYIQSLPGGNRINPSEYIGIASQEYFLHPRSLTLAPESHDGWKRFAFPFGFRALPRKLTCPREIVVGRLLALFKWPLFSGTLIRFLGV